MRVSVLPATSIRLLIVNTADIYDDPPILTVLPPIEPFNPSHPAWKFLVDLTGLAVLRYEFEVSQELRTSEIEFLLFMIDLFEKKCTGLRIENRHLKRQNDVLRREVAPPD
ncbi:hypothetical protein C0995_004348, partial [Termitomyces sp. Mi166